MFALSVHYGMSLNLTEEIVGSKPPIFPSLSTGKSSRSTASSPSKRSLRLRCVTRSRKVLHITEREIFLKLCRCEFRVAGDSYEGESLEGIPVHVEWTGARACGLLRRPPQGAGPKRRTRSPAA